MRFFLSLFLSLVGCTALQPDEDFREVPATNNPHIIQDPRPQGVLPPGFG